MRPKTMGKCLRNIVEWLDQIDEMREVHGIRTGDEIQQDLLRLSYALDERPRLARKVYRLMVKGY